MCYFSFFFFFTIFLYYNYQRLIFNKTKFKLFHTNLKSKPHINSMDTNTILITTHNNSRGGLANINMCLDLHGCKKVFLFMLFYGLSLRFVIVFLIKSFLKFKFTFFFKNIMCLIIIPNIF